ncbi:MAG TPA: hypothetical protein VMF09_05485 [Solirubrobacteraceae bacterium]|nr:hypothetical protein [Solirubrobacteraceae bacterium]
MAMLAAGDETTGHQISPLLMLAAVEQMRIVRRVDLCRQRSRRQTHVGERLTPRYAQLCKLVVTLAIDSPSRAGEGRTICVFQCLACHGDRLSLITIASSYRRVREMPALRGGCFQPAR